MSFFVTAIAYYPEKKEYSKPHNTTRTFGHFQDLPDAQRAVERNQGDMSECLYNYLVIEKIGYGIHTLVEENPIGVAKEYWYKYDDHEQQWFQINKPEWSVGTTNWSIG